ncbi:hypothetical protein NQZ79_g5999 [Umbelopsis isabellina]|nr:hypothetical protein NQZ79_g5999 [Umbelopsis isabellina]
MSIPETAKCWYSQCCCFAIGDRLGSQGTEAKCCSKGSNLVFGSWLEMPSRHMSDMVCVNSSIFKQGVQDQNYLNIDQPYSGLLCRNRDRTAPFYGVRQCLRSTTSTNIMPLGWLFVWPCNNLNQFSSPPRCNAGSGQLPLGPFDTGGTG